MHRFEDLRGRIVTIAVSQDGTQAAAGSDEGEIIIWDLKTHIVIARVVGHSGAVNKLAFCGNDGRLLSAGSDTTVRIWDFKLPEDIVAWTRENRYIRDLTMEELKMVGIESP